MKTKKLIPLSTVMLIVCPLFADFPDPDPLRTLNARYDFKQFGMTQDYTYDASTWDTMTFLDRTVFQYSDGNVAANGTNSTGGPLATQGFELRNNYTFTLDSGNALTFAWINTSNNAKINLNGATLNITGAPPSGASDNWFNSGSMTLTNGASFTAPQNVSIRQWNHTITSADSSITGGINAWHSGGINLTNSTWYAKGTTIFQHHGNGNYSMVLDNSHATLEANNAEGTSYSQALALYAHGAITSSPLSIELKNGSTFTAGTFNADGYAVIGGGEGWMGWTSQDNAKITIDVQSGSSLVMGTMTMGREAANQQYVADYKISVSGTDDSARSLAAFQAVNMSLTDLSKTYEGSPPAENYRTTIEVGDYADFRATALNIGSKPNAKAGTASVTIGSNSTFYVLTNGYGGEAAIGSAARSGGLAEISMTGENSTFFTSRIFLGNAASEGGTNRFIATNTSAVVNNIYTFEIGLRNSTSASSSMVNEFVIDGNAYIHGRPGTGDTSLRFNIGTNQSAGGSSTVILKGENVTFGYLFQVNIGNDSSTGGVSKLSLQTSDIYRDSNKQMLISDRLYVNASGGAEAILEFVADSNGFAYVSADSIVFTGTLVLDFSLLAEGDLTQNLLQFRNTGNANFAAWEDFCNDLVAGDASHLQISKKYAGDELAFTYLNGTLGIEYTMVPEPGTYATVFAAIALAFAVYRRKRKV